MERKVFLIFYPAICAISGLGLSKSPYIDSLHLPQTAHLRYLIDDSLPAALWLCVWYGREPVSCQHASARVAYYTAKYEQFGVITHLSVRKARASRLRKLFPGSTLKSGEIGPVMEGHTSLLEGLGCPSLVVPSSPKSFYPIRTADARSQGQAHHLSVCLAGRGPVRMQAAAVCHCNPHNCAPEKERYGMV